MKHQPRNVLKGYFKAGERPTQDQFAELIDSTLNIHDEGFDKTRPDGLRIASLGDSNMLMSFYHGDVDARRAEWSAGFEDLPDRLVFRRPLDDPDGPPSTPLITLDARPYGDGRKAAFRGDTLRTAVGVGTINPQDTLDVAGVVRSRGRRGQAHEPIRADGGFYPLTGWLRGCQAFEVIAGVGHQGTGRFALLHAVAMNAFNPTWWDNLLPFNNKRPIRSQHAVYSNRADRLELRWRAHDGDPSAGHGAAGQFRLELRTRSDYQRAVDGEGGDGKAVFIQAYVTQLWFDDFAAGETR